MEAKFAVCALSFVVSFRWPPTRGKTILKSQAGWSDELGPGH